MEIKWTYPDESEWGASVRDCWPPWLASTATSCHTNFPLMESFRCAATTMDRNNNNPDSWHRWRWNNYVVKWEWILLWARWERMEGGERAPFSQSDANHFQQGIITAHGLNKLPILLHGLRIHILTMWKMHGAYFAWARPRPVSLPQTHTHT